MKRGNVVLVLYHDSLVSCINLATIRQDRVDRVIGSLPDSLMRHIDRCLMAAPGL
ncbi:hypothetical protein HY285_03525 [Candidatus Peregrinibacteria bacterium]|nr:hypothetical protein [Candidatus Peregrinibacteria bacterium]MBI3816586.1 hypothetical protein [Candidatus Peregrinibacteria bacterium]